MKHLKKIGFIITFLFSYQIIIAQSETQKKGIQEKGLSNKSQQEKGLKRNEEIRKGWDGKMPTADNCPEWLDFSTGRLNYFDIPEGYIIDAPEWCEPFGVKNMIIRKGIYEVDWKANKNAGLVIFLLLKSQDPPALKAAGVAGNRPISLSCKFYGHRCAKASIAVNNEDKLKLTLSPVIENGKWVAIKLQYGNGNPSLPLIK